MDHSRAQSRIVAENDLVRCDVVCLRKRYEITYIYLCEKDKVTKRGTLIAYTIRSGQEKRVKKWFYDNYPYESIAVKQIE